MLFNTKKTQRAINLRLNWPFESGWKEAKNCYYRGHCTWVHGDTTSLRGGSKKKFPVIMTVIRITPQSRPHTVRWQAIFCVRRFKRWVIASPHMVHSFLFHFPLLMGATYIFAQATASKATSNQNRHGDGTSPTHSHLPTSLITTDIHCNSGKSSCDHRI